MIKNKAFLHLLDNKIKILKFIITNVDTSLADDLAYQLNDKLIDLLNDYISKANTTNVPCDKFCLAGIRLCNYLDKQLKQNHITIFEYQDRLAKASTLKLVKACFAFKGKTYK